jgi:transglutaminase-like putative cysteine protease
MHALLASALLVWLTTLGFPDSAAASDSVRRANSIERVVRFEVRATNVSDAPEDIWIHLPLPFSNERQEILALHPEPGASDISADLHGNRVAAYLEKGVPPGEVRARGWIAAVRTFAAAYEGPGAPGQLSKDERARYTQDSENYQVRSPIIQKLKESLVREKATDEETTWAIYEHVIRSVSYFRDAQWDPAPAVLERGQGSCSEFSYALMALLRASGIPCRYTGALILTADNVTKYDPAIHEDTVFHRWVEVYLETRGWFPMDPSRGSGALRRFDNVLNYWGRVPSGSLQVFRGDGGEDTPLGWDYTGNARSAHKDAVKKTATCTWIEASCDRLEAALANAEKVLAAPVEPEKLAPMLREPLMREAILFLANHRQAEPRDAFHAALLLARHPAAVYQSAIARSENRTLPENLRLESLADESLRTLIAGTLALGPKGRAAFERWWRKARPEIVYSEEKGRFVVLGKIPGLD